MQKNIVQTPKHTLVVNTRTNMSSPSKPVLCCALPDRVNPVLLDQFPECHTIKNKLIGRPSIAASLARDMVIVSIDSANWIVTKKVPWTKTILGERTSLILNRGGQNSLALTGEGKR